MDLRDEIRSRLAKTHREAIRYYDEGNIARAKSEYLSCAGLTEQLARHAWPAEKQKLMEKARKFVEIADGLKEGNIKVYTSGVKPAQEPPPPAPAPRHSEEDSLKSKIKGLVLKENPNVTFADVAGLEVAKEAIMEAIVYPFKYPEEYHYFGVRPGGGILLYGPPRCGKTMLAAAAATECGATFISIKVSDIKGKYVGESEKNVKEIFNLARQCERAILFFDEIDSLAGQRSEMSEEHDISLVGELLAQMDGLESKGTELQYLVIAATNRPWGVDIGLRAPGRFDTTVFIPHPDSAARRKIFELNLKDRPVDGSVDLDELTQKTEGYASAEVVAICQRAARIPLRERIKEKKPRRQISKADFEKVLAGTRSVLPAWYRRALKELGHADEADVFQNLIETAKEYNRVFGDNSNGGG